jgi:GGDEF domain-containing protein
VLRRTATAIEMACRGADVAFRIGGDEFALMLPDTGREEALEVAQRVQATVDAVDSRTTASFGVAVWPDDGGSKDVLLAHADGGLYEAKAGGRRPARRVDGERRLAVANRLAVALAGKLDPADIARLTAEELGRSLGVTARLEPDPAAAGTPVHAGSRAWGVICVDEPLGDEDRLLVETIAFHVGSALHRAELERTIEGLRGLSPESDPRR